jgi:ribokinase
MVWSSGAVRRKRPTIVDVAREAGVSIGTVSNVCNGSARVRPKTRERVEAAMQRLAYRPNALARSLIGLSGNFDETARLRLPHLMTVGYISVDYMARVEVLPHRDDRITAHHIEKALGGPAANVAVAAAALGGAFALDVELATAIGEDPDSEWALAELSRKGVHALPIRRPYHNRMSRCFVIVEANGSRTIINEPFELTETDLAAHLPVREEDRPRCLHVEGYHVGRMQKTIARFRGSGWKVSLHTTGLPEHLRNARDFAALLASYDLVFVNTETARAVLGLRAGLADVVEAFTSYLATCSGRGSVVLTLAERGASVFAAGGCEAVRLPALPVEVVDATGAGDAFAGAFLATWLNGRDPVEAARYANVAAALAVTAEGAQAGLTGAAEIERLLEPGAATVGLGSAA